MYLRGNACRWGTPQAFLVERELRIQCINDDAVYHSKAGMAVSDCRDCHHCHFCAFQFWAAVPAGAFRYEVVAPCAAVHNEERFAHTCRDPDHSDRGLIAAFAR